MPFYEQGAAQGRLRAGRAQRARNDSRQPALHLPPREGADRCAQRRHLPRRRHRSRIAAVVLPVGPAARQGTDRRGAAPRAVDRCRPRAHARRMLADPRAEALASRFAAQWLRLQDVEKVRPDPNFYPNFDENLAEAMRTETKMFFESLVREDRSLLDLLTADYTFVNERLARHYGFPGVARPRFPPRHLSRLDAPRHSRPGQHAGADLARQPHLAGAARQVGDGSADGHAAAATAAERARPRSRRRSEGRPAADDARADGDPSRRTRPAASCHRFMDPIGLALDNFDVTAQVARARERHAARHHRRFLRRHARSRRCAS